MHSSSRTIISLFYNIIFSLARGLLRYEHNQVNEIFRIKGIVTMFDRSFFQTKLGLAAIASTSAMVLFVALSTQMHVSPHMVATSAAPIVEIA